MLEPGPERDDLPGWVGPTRGGPTHRDGLAPRTFQGRLTLGFVAVVAITLGLVGAIVLNRLGAYFDQQQRDDLNSRAAAVAQYVLVVTENASPLRPILTDKATVNQLVVGELQRGSHRDLLANTLAQADVQVQLGWLAGDPTDERFVAASNGTFAAVLDEGRVAPAPGQARERLTSQPYVVANGPRGFAVEVVLSNPYTYRGAAIANVTGLLAVIGLIALAVAVVIAAALARRFTTPLRRLTEASRDLGEGDLARRVPDEALQAGATELSELGLQFNAMAARLQESVEIIRRDRDRGREFLADVSHELRTPIAALRTFNELLVEGAADDPATRLEFLEASRAQLERLDWLAQNLLELSKLDSGLVLLDLRRDDLRSSVEQAVDGSMTTARRRGVDLTLELPGSPVVIRHDPVRISQVVSNLVGNAVKFTPRGGSVRVTTRAGADGGATIEVSDTGIGIDPAELPRIFDRFYRGSRASEARGSGSGLGLAIVRSIVEMHGGNVTVESRLGQGSTFRVTLPAQPRLTPEVQPTRMAETSPSGAKNLNPQPAP
ncbi:MAG TPA: HAMP domain-containing sensor histidine kinase [Candidatus Deferrimicrobiaceae bacterium]|nr:HAMP domain-containing sensor histidine kinase [Candidatus Deferrimicrobiaceae bacterium]